MLVVTCPACRATIVRNPDGTCPVCGTLIRPGQAEPFVVTTAETTSDRPTGRPTPEFVSPSYGDQPRRPPDFAAGPQIPIIRFHHRLLEITPRLFVTQTLVALNIVVFALMVFAGAGLLSPGADQLIAWGANFGPKTLAGQWWRLLTCTFVHIGLIHVALNMWVLWDVGHFVERLAGNVGFAVLYVISGLAGSLASVYWNPTVLSAGASGAVFGVFGAMLGFVLLRGDSVPKQILGSLRNSGGMFLLYNLVFGLAIEGIDMAAHAGGLVAGFVCGAILSQPLDRVNRVTRSIRNVLTLAVGSAGIAAAILAAPSPPGDIRAELDRVSKVEKEVEEIYQDAVRANRAGTLSDEQLLEILEARVLRPWQDVREAFGRMETTRLPATQRRLVAKLQKEIQAREDDWRARVAALREHIGAKRKALQRGNVDPVD